ncbi:MAG: 16S rRNA (cytosine(1402)-N(4))-methyltransferase RsmH [Deltaproteobacteria bacterium]|nr:16S rRNA (cytosine(1402)-N(4))-methyltransferase RsmH [Deltaproteobacteria bacterium]
MHVSVLLHETIELLRIRPDGLYLDATAGGGGHAEAILRRLGAGGRLVVADCDPQAVEGVKEKFGNDPRVQIFHARFSELFEILTEKKLTPVDGMMADLGVSSLQLADPARGIGFMPAGGLRQGGTWSRGPLDMRMDPRLSQTADDLIATSTEKELADLIYQLGGERRSRRLARMIVMSREKGPLHTTEQLRLIAERALGPFYRRQKIHPATRLFLALRIAVNREMEELDSLLESIPKVLRPGGRAAVISFHSLEDRKVKQKFLALRTEGWNPVTKKPVTPSVEEIKNNPRSRSAKLRVIEKSQE